MNRLKARLNGLAQTGQTITYGAVAKELAVRVQDLTAALEALMEDDAREGRPLLAALCEGRLSGGLPANGFFQKAAELGYDVSDPAALVADHRAALFKP
jgi:hypothetical protein